MGITLRRMKTHSNIQSRGANDWCDMHNKSIFYATHIQPLRARPIKYFYLYPSFHVRARARQTKRTLFTRSHRGTRAHGTL